MNRSKIVDLLGLSEFKEKILSLLPKKISELENDSKYIQSNNGDTKIFFGVSGLNNPSMKLTDIYSSMPQPSVLYYSTANEIDELYIQNKELLEIVQDHGVCGTLCIVKNNQDRSHIEYTVGLSNGTKPYMAIIGISRNGEINNDNVFWIDGSSFIPLTTSLAVTEEGISALDGTVGKVLDDKGSQISFYKSDDGQWHFRDWSGADTVIPFNKDSTIKIVSTLSVSATNNYSYGDSRSTTCTITISDNSLTISGNSVTYQTVDSAKKTVTATAAISNAKIVLN